MADRSVIVRLSANVTGLVNGLRTGTRALEDFGTRGMDAVSRNEKHINTLATGVGALGLALVGMAGVAVKSFADFDEAMSGVEASGDDAANSLGALREAALQAGADTKYSATEAANGIEEMAKAGVSAADILNGGLNGALSLAAAGQLDVAKASEIASTTMNQFGLAGEDVGRIADVLAASAGKANGEVADFGLAMKYVGPVAAQLGVSLEETSGTLALLAQNGILADSAGTGLRGVMMSLTAPTKVAAEEMAKYNIAAFDGQDQFIGLAGLAGQLHDRLGDLGEAERSAALGRIFGNEQITTARILYQEGASAVDEWTTAVDDQGYAAEVAATKMDNLKGDIEQFTGALETAFIQGGEGGNAMLRGLTQGLTDVINGFNELPGPIQQASFLLVGGAGLVTLGAAGLAKLVTGVNDTRLAMQGLGLSARTAGLAVAGVGIALAAGALAVAAWAEAQATAKANADALAQTLDQQTGAITSNTRETIKAQLSQERTMLGFIKRADSAYDNARKLGISLDLVTDAAMGNTSAMEELSDILHATDGDLVAQRDAAEAAGLSLTDYGQAQEDLEDAVTSTNGSLERGTEVTKQKAEVDAEAGGAQDDLTQAYEATTAAVTEQVDALGDMIDAQREASGVVLSERDAQRQLEQATADVNDAVEKNGKTLDITTQKGRDNQATLDAVADAGWGLIESMEANGSTQEELQGVMATSRQRFLDAAAAMGMGADEANALADELGLIPAAVYTHIEVETDAAQQRIDAWMERNRNRKLTVEVEATGSGSAVYRTAGGTRFEASGGYIAGPGTGTSDSIPARLSNGEYVIKASAVSQYGRAFFDAVNAQRFAAGGMVGSAPTVSGGGGGTPAVYVQNPFTGEYLLAQVSSVAQSEAVRVGRLSLSKSR